ncbi:MAG: hypothetical protein ABSD20_17390 [Terriglobales bacterium]|jgi:hypothetical protein
MNSGAALEEFSIEIGGMAALVRTSSLEFAGLLKRRYGSFAIPPVAEPMVLLDIDLSPPAPISEEERLRDLSVRLESGHWIMERGDFKAEWDPECRRGRVRQALNPYGIDAVLRIMHTLILARENGFLLHSASAVRNGRAFLFTGVSGAGKTTITRLAPPDVTLLTDEISYVKRSALPSSPSAIEAEPETENAEHATKNVFYEAFGTPFSGELGVPGENVRAPLGALFLLAQAPASCQENKIERISKGEAVRGLLRNILFFAQDPKLVRMVFQSVADFVSRVPVFRLHFTPDARVWELIA